VGEVSLSDFVSVWHNVVIRGDINVVRILTMTSIGDRTVIHTANSLPTGIPAIVHIGSHVTIQAGCSLYSCIIEDECFIGANSVIMEGSRIEKGAIILPNSVVPPGRLIPAAQVWGGNPVQYIRDAKESEIFANYAYTLQIYELSQIYYNQFTPWSYSYLQKETTKDDLDLRPEDMILASRNHYNFQKYYYDYGSI
jgi:carbonic anhydrase/acetyltransferase-like protein (isoleucine patch superfamily)